MESAFTGLVRKHRVLFKLNRSITSHNTIITGLLIFHQVLLFFYLLCLTPFVSPTLTVPAAQPGLVLANATGMKE